MTFVIIIMNGLQLWSAQLLCIVAVLGADFGCIYTHPQQVTGYVGERLTYHCDANCGEKFWRINNTIISEGLYPYQAVIDGSILRSTLSVEASAAINNSIVTCWVFNPPNNVESMSVTIIVQGTTEGPGNLLLNYNENYVNLSWNKPYILPDTVLIEYKVTVSTERNISSFTTTDTSLSFPHSVLNLDPCPLNQSVNISVAGVNQVGVGEPATTEALIVQSQSEANCTEVNISPGAPTNVTAVIDGNSLLVSWQLPPLTLLTDILGYKLMINITIYQDPLTNLMTQTVSTNQTFFVIPLVSFGIDRCNGEYSFEISVTALDLTNREGKSALATIEISCTSTTKESEDPNMTFETTASPADSSVILIVVGVTVTGVVTTLLAIGASMAILLHTIRKYKLKTFASSEQNQSQNVSKDDNSTYGVMELKFNGAYDYKPKSELDHHVYEEIGAF